MLSHTAALTPLAEGNRTMGRPRLDAARQRTQQFGLRLTAAEAAAVRTAAQREGVPPVTWLRRLALEAAGRPSPELSPAERDRLKQRRAIWRELRRVGVLLNQVARRFHAGDVVGGDELRAALADVRRTVDEELDKWSPGQ